MLRSSLYAISETALPPATTRYSAQGNPYATALKKHVPASELLLRPPYDALHMRERIVHSEITPSSCPRRVTNDRGQAYHRVEGDTTVSRDHVGCQSPSWPLLNALVEKATQQVSTARSSECVAYRWGSVQKAGGLPWRYRSNNA